MSITKEDINDFQSAWSDAVINKDIEKLLTLYADQAVLKPTLSNSIRRNQTDIREYFLGVRKFEDAGFFNNNFDSVTFIESSPMCNGNIATDTGIYEFSRNDGTSVKAHYSFFYQLNSQNKLEVLSQHSSLLVNLE